MAQHHQRGPPVAARACRHICLASWHPPRHRRCQPSAQCDAGNALSPDPAFGNVSKAARWVNRRHADFRTYPRLRAVKRDATCGLHGDTGPVQRAGSKKGRFAKRPYIVRWGLSKHPFDRPCDLYSAIFRSTADVLPFLPVSSSNETFWPSFRSVMPAA